MLKYHRPGQTPAPGWVTALDLVQPNRLGPRAPGRGEPYRVAAGGDTRIDTFGFQPGRLLSGKYEVVRCLGAGWEGEVYLVREQGTGIERTAKFFFPQRNPREVTSRRYARRLHRLRHCPMVIQYHVHETVRFRGRPVRSATCAFT